MLNHPHTTLPDFAEGLFAPNDAALQSDLQSRMQDVHSRDGLQARLSEYLEETVAPWEATVVCMAVRLGESRSLDGALALDAEIDKRMWPPRRREASRRMGRQAIQMAAAAIDSPVLAALSIRAEAGATPCHHPLAFGLIGGRLGWPPHAAAEAYLQASAATFVQAARGRFGVHDDEEDLLWSAGEQIARLARKVAESGALKGVAPRSPALLHAMP